MCLNQYGSLVTVVAPLELLLRWIWQVLSFSNKKMGGNFTCSCSKVKSCVQLDCSHVIFALLSVMLDLEMKACLLWWGVLSGEG